MPEFRVAPEPSLPPREYNWKKDAVRFDNGWNSLLGQSCHESLDAVGALMSTNPETHP